MKKRFLTILIGLFFLNILSADAQWITSLTLSKDTLRYPTSGFRAIAFEMDASLKELPVIKFDNKKIVLTPDSHSPVVNGWQKSNLIVFDEPKYGFNLSENNQTQLKMAYLIHTPDLLMEFPQKNTAFDTCLHPQMILQEDWRIGLPEPDYERIPNQVRHQIIHHSATSNELTDYANLVRSIYLYHTEVNGWSDIGYNYLISPNGWIFAGRDPGEELLQDEVLGAHFCSSNTGTMGICLLGTFTDQLPSSEALSTLNQLLGWKAANANLDPEGSFVHPLNNALGTIAGHSDGCATSCPGETLASLLPEIRAEVIETIHDCGVFPGINSWVLYPDIKVYPNPVTHKKLAFETSYNMSKAVLMDLGLRKLHEWYDPQNRQTLTLPQNINDGLYIILIYSGSEVVRPIKIIVNNHK